MKKKVWKRVALALALGLIIAVCWFANALNGNPISQMLAEHSADRYLSENFPDTDYYIEKVGYSFKTANYYAQVRSETSIDTQFTLYIDMWGSVYWDTYDSMRSGSITARRLDQEYRALTDQIFESPSYPYKSDTISDIYFGTLEIYPREAIDDPNATDIPDWSLVQEELILDKLYDIRELGAQAGHLIVYVDTDTLTAENAAGILLEIRKIFDEAGIPFRAIDLTLRYPRTTEGVTSEDYFGMEWFDYEDIYAEGLVERVAEADAALKAYRAELDAETAKLLETAPTE